MRCLILNENSFFVVLKEFVDQKKEITNWAQNKLYFQVRQLADKGKIRSIGTFKTQKKYLKADT